MLTNKSYGKRMMPEYLINFVRDIYEGPVPLSFGRSLVKEANIKKLETYYKLFRGTAKKNYGERMVPNYLLKYIEKLVNADYVEYVDDLVAYIKETPQKALKYGFLNKVGGMSYKYNQISDNTSGSGTDTSSTNVITIYLTSVANVCVVGHKYLMALNALVSDNSKLVSLRVRRPFVSSETNFLSTISRYYFIGEATETTSPQMQIIKSFASETNETYSFDTVDVIDLTEIFGSGNEPSNISTAKTQLKAVGIDIDQDNEYNLGTIRDGAVTSVNDFTIAAEIQALEGYGMGINDTCYNYIDYDAKKFIQKVAKIVFNGSEDWQDRPNFNDCDRFVLNTDRNYKANGSGICDRFIYTNTLVSTIGYIINNNGEQLVINYSAKGTTTLAQFKQALENNPIILYIELATPIETDISDYIKDNIIDVSSGELKFNNEHEQAVPSEVTYYVEA